MRATSPLTSAAPRPVVALVPLLPLVIGLAFASCRSTPADLPGTHPRGGPAITVEWIYSDEGRAVGSVPSFAWRADGQAVLWDDTRPERARTFERLDPATGARATLVDRERALASLAEVADVDPSQAWRWPDGVDRAGAQGLYLLDGDLYVLDLASSAFRRATETEAEEKCASFSPDGRRVAFVRENDLWALELASGEERRLTNDGSETTLNGTLSWVYWEEIFGRRDIGYWWSDDSSSIAYLQTDESPVGVAHFLAFEDPYAELITQRYPKAGTPNPAVRVGVVGVGGTPTAWIEIPEEHEYVARVQWLPGSRRLAVQTLTRDQRRLDLFFAEASGERAALVLSETDDAWINIHDDLWFLEDGEHFVWASERSGFNHLYLYKLDGELVRPITQGPWAIASSGGGVFWLRQAVCALDEAHQQIYFTGLKDSSVERQLYRVNLDGSGLERVSQESGTHAITFAPDASRYFDVYSNIRTPPALSLHDAGGARLFEVAPPYLGELARFDVQYPELTTIPARDGFEMPAWILRPADFDPHRHYPLILYVYGGPSAPTVANAWDDDILYDQVLLDAGYLVARCDNRSATAISKTLESTIVGRSIGDVERDDYTDAVRWLGRCSYVDPGRLGIWGWSGGASMTLLMLTRSREFKAGIAVAPVTDWRYYDTKWAEFTMKRPEDNPEGYAHTSLAEHAADLSGRLLLVHGTYDDNVHPQNTWRFVDELVDAGVQFDMMIYPMRKHGIRDRAARVHLFSKMTEFWQRNL